MKEILLSQGRAALVDDDDYDWLKQWKWYAFPNPRSHTFYAARGIRIAKYKQRIEWMHRLILGLQRDDKKQCDHVDGNGLNNRRTNLRICTVAQNHQSQIKRRMTASKYKGVYWNHRARKWRAHIGVNKKSIHLGYFDSEAIAATAYNTAALKHFGKFALLNTF